MNTSEITLYVYLCHYCDILTTFIVLAGIYIYIYMMMQCSSVQAYITSSDLIVLGYKTKCINCY